MITRIFRGLVAMMYLALAGLLVLLILAAMVAVAVVVA